MKKTFDKIVEDHAVTLRDTISEERPSSNIVMRSKYWEAKNGGVFSQHVTIKDAGKMGDFLGEYFGGKLVEVGASIVLGGKSGRIDIYDKSLQNIVENTVRNFKDLCGETYTIVSG